MKYRLRTALAGTLVILGGAALTGTGLAGATPMNYNTPVARAGSAAAGRLSDPTYLALPGSSLRPSRADKVGPASSGKNKQPKPAPSPTPTPTTKTTTLRGTWANEAACFLPHSVTPNPDPSSPSVKQKCTGGSAYAGALNGHSIYTQEATVDAAGNEAGTFDEWVYASYSGDHNALGGLHYQGVFSVDGKTNAFYAAAQILGGTCYFANAIGGSALFDGTVTGGYTMQVTQTVPLTDAPAVPSACNPIDRVPFSVP